MDLTLKGLEESIREEGYLPRRQELLFLADALTASQGIAGIRSIILEGLPGTGKTKFAEVVASIVKAPIVVHQMHQWTDADELFVGVDVAAAVGGDAANVRQDGVLAQVARLSERGPVILLLDEVDKTHERCEALLLDYLQSGRVPVKPGVHLRTVIHNVIVFLTSNAMRDLSDALYRRCGRVQMGLLPFDTQVSIISSKAGVPTGLTKLIWKASIAVASAEGNKGLSLQEGQRLVSHIVKFAASADDIKLIVSGWAARTVKGRKAAANSNVAAIWGELNNLRKS